MTQKTHEMNVMRKYLDQIVSVLSGITNDQSEALDAATSVVVEALKKNKLVYVVGSGHSHLIAAEAFFRAGGIAAVQPILDPSLMLHISASKSSLIEREPGSVARVLSNYDIKEGDVVFIVSNSGRNAFPIEAAAIVKQRGAATVAITSIKHTTAVSARHASGKRLFELVDIVLDNGAEYGDASVDVGPQNLPMGPTSTISGCFIINAVMAQAVDLLSHQGVQVDVYRSSNGENGEAAVDVIVERWKPRIRGL